MRHATSVYGNVQPDVLRELINGEDATGGYLLLSCSAACCWTTTAQPMRSSRLNTLRTFRSYASRLYTCPPRTNKLSQQARATINAWFNKHQTDAQLPAVDGVIRSLLGKTSAHALRLAGNLHLLKVVAGEVTPDERISPQTMDVAMAIVDQLTRETEAFHDAPETETTLLMRHVHQVAWAAGKPVDRKTVRNKSTRALKALCSAEKFNAAVHALVDQRYGTSSQDVSLNGRPKALFYSALKEMCS